MKQVGTFVLLLAVSFTVWADDSAALMDNPYTPVVTRNLFGLVPIPIATPDADSKPKDPPPKILPNGIMKMSGQLQVLFKVSVPAKQGQPQHDQSYIMSEGERQDEITVVKIDDQASTITFDNHGVVQDLPLTAAANVSAPAPAPGAAPAGSAPPQMPSPANRPGLANNPALQRRLTQTQGQNGNPANFGAANNAAGLTAGANSNPHIYNPAAEMGQQLSPEDQAARIELNRQQAIENHSPSAGLFPPTRYTQEANQMFNNGGNNTGNP